MISTECGNGSAANEPAGEAETSDNATATLQRSLMNSRHCM